MNAVSYTPRYPSWDRFRPTLLKISLAVSILFCFFVMNVETVASKMEPIDYGPPIEKVFVMDTPPTIHKKKEIPPPKPPEPKKTKELIPTKIEAVDKVEEIKVEEKIFMDPDVDAVSTGPVEIPVTAVAPKIDIPEEPEPVEKIWDRVEQMPIFGECSLDDYEGAELRNCSDKALLEFVYGNLKYPSFARKNGIEGMAVIRFVVDKDGQVINVEVVRGEQGGLGDAAKKVILKMPKWKPGKQNGRPVKVQYTIPIKFKLN